MKNGRTIKNLFESLVFDFWLDFDNSLFETIGKEEMDKMKPKI